MPVTQLPRSIPALALVTSILALTACTGPDPTPPSRSSPPPVFANEEEALAAVTETYGRFVEISNTIASEKGSQPERILEVMSPDAATTEIDGFGMLSGSGLDYIGAARVDGVRLQTWSANPDADGVLASALTCLDISGMDVVDATGTSVAPPDRVTRLPFAIEIGNGVRDGSFLITSKVLQEGASVCDGE